MSNIPISPSPFVVTVDKITSQTLTYAPALAAAVQAIDDTKLANGTKQELVVNTVLSTTGALASNPDPRVAAAAALVNLFVALFKAARSHPSVSVA